jgi:hypothetical protein
MAAAEEGAQVAADLGLPAAGARKPPFPTDAVAQTAEVFAALAGSTSAVDAAAIARQFRGGKKVEERIAGVLMSLARLGHITSTDGGKTFTMRRAA